MFTVNEYKIVFKRRWHQKRLRKDSDPAHADPTLVEEDSDGRYDTVCEIYVKCTATINGEAIYREKPSFTGIAKLHPNDSVDRVVGKKIALRNAMLAGYKTYEKGRKTKVPIYHSNFTKQVRTAIWKAFWAWVATWPKKPEMDVRQIVIKYLKENGFDGLYAEGCGCEISDLMPCDMPCEDCKPGYKSSCDPETWIGPKQLHNDTETDKTKGGCPMET